MQTCGDWKNFVKRLRRMIERVEEPPFRSRCEIKDPLLTRHLRSFKEDTATREGMSGFCIAPEIEAFYAVCNGFKLTWQHLHPPRADLIVTGAARIMTVTQLYDPEENIGQPFVLYGEYRKLDEIGSDYHVAARFARGQTSPDLFYYNGEVGQYRHLSLGFTDYMTILLGVGGLFPWQEFFIDEPGFRLDTRGAEEFLEKLHFVFPDSDDSLFRAHLAAGRRNGD